MMVDKALIRIIKVERATYRATIYVNLKISKIHCNYESRINIHWTLGESLI